MEFSIKYSQVVTIFLKEKRNFAKKKDKGQWERGDQEVQEI
jgi:hypothetical protein